MAVSFFGGSSGSGGRVWSISRFVDEELNQEQLLERIRELEALCTEVLVAGVDIGLPQRLLNQLWGAVGHGELPHAYNVDLPARRNPIAPAAPAATAAALVPAPEAVARPAVPMAIPDIPLTSNPLTSPERNESRPTPPQVELKPLAVTKTCSRATSRRSRPSSWP